MEKVINQTNSYGQRHGYSEEFHDNKQTWSKRHFFEDILIGYYELYDTYGKIQYKLNWMNSKEIGCEQYKNSQYYYNKFNKKFGEQIVWSKLEVKL